MKHANKFLTAAGIVALSVATNVGTADAAESEKCYGVVKAGQNDCGSSDGAHSCAGYASADGLATEWILLPEGTCERIVGGSLQGPSS